LRTMDGHSTADDAICQVIVGCLDQFAWHNYVSLPWWGCQRIAVNRFPERIDRIPLNLESLCPFNPFPLIR
jgi:hypothetical protein